MNDFPVSSRVIRPARPNDIPEILEDLYERVGGEILHEWRIVRLDKQGIRELREK